MYSLSSHSNKLSHQTKKVLQVNFTQFKEILKLSQLIYQGITLRSK